MVILNKGVLCGLRKLVFYILEMKKKLKACGG